MVTINGRVFTTTYDAGTRTFSLTSPTGRQDSAVLDDHGRPVQEQPGGLDPSSYAYDSRGRLTTATHGHGANSRVTQMGYGSDGFLSSFTDASGRTTTVSTDAAGRVTEQTLPNGRLVRYAYDASGNVTAVTPPGAQAHTFSYTARDQVLTSTRPTVGAESGQTTYAYDLDGQLTRVDQPDGQSVTYQHDVAGRRTVMGLASGQRSYTYDGAGKCSGEPAPTHRRQHAHADNFADSAHRLVAAGGNWLVPDEYRGRARPASPQPLALDGDRRGIAQYRREDIFVVGRACRRIGCRGESYARNCVERCQVVGFGHHAHLGAVGA
jgi:YD repeat-containing protein